MKVAILELINKVENIQSEVNNYVYEKIIQEYELSSEEVEKLRKEWIQYLTSEWFC